jgi:sporulation protein YlmC with PRC-barrel domain
MPRSLEEIMASKALIAALLTTVLFAGTTAAQTIPSKTDALATDTHREGEWRASKLVGVNVYNNANEKIGDINDVIVDRSGKVAEVILGVGGFLGMGEHYVAVAYDKLKWVNEPVSSTTAARSSDRPARPATNVDSNARTASDGAPPVTTGIATTSASSNRTSSAYWYPDHAVFNATKDQLKAMPQFQY